MQVHARQQGLSFTPMEIGVEIGGEMGGEMEAATTVSYAGTDATNSDEEYE